MFAINFFLCEKNTYFAPQLKNVTKKVHDNVKSLSNNRKKEDDRLQRRSLKASHQACFRPQSQDQEILVRG